jgi:hypothetical protein
MSKFFVMQQEKCLHSLLAPQLRILWFPLEIPKVLKKLVKSLDSATQWFAPLALCNLKMGILCVLLFLLRFSNLEVERCTLLWNFMSLNGDNFTALPDIFLED